MGPKTNKFKGVMSRPRSSSFPFLSNKTNFFFPLKEKRSASEPAESPLKTPHHLEEAFERSIEPGTGAPGADFKLDLTKLENSKGYDMMEKSSVCNDIELMESDDAFLVSGYPKRRRSLSFLFNQWRTRSSSKRKITVI